MPAPQGGDGGGASTLQELPMASEEAVPTIDLLLADSDPEGFGKAMSQACERSGVFYCANHMMDEGLLGRVRQAQRDFFALPIEVKGEAKLGEAHRRAGFVRGYLGVGAESGSSLYEVKEGYSMGYDWEGSDRGTPSNPLQGPNAWPGTSAGFDEKDWRKTMNEFFGGLSKIAGRVTQGLSLALGLGQEGLDGNCDMGDTISLLRLFHYLPYTNVTDKSEVETSQCIGSSPHTDWGWLTLILQDDTCLGLQLCDPKDGQWYNVPPKPGLLTVNIGDYVSLLTKGKFHSPLHRVVTPSQERFSSVFFFYPNYEAKPPAIPEDFSREISFLKDQREQKEGDKEAAKEGGAKGECSFGEFILNKWGQVQRD